MEAVNIAVIGANGVGKSSFVQRALRLPRPPTSNINAIRLDVESVPHVVALIELDLEYFDVNPNQKIRWPKQMNGHMVPRIDGALILYDVMNKDSIRDLPHTLCMPRPFPLLAVSSCFVCRFLTITAALGITGLPTMLVATKCDNPENARQINANAMATVFPSILADFKTSANVPASTRDCLQSIVLASVFNRKGMLITLYSPHPCSATFTLRRVLPLRVFRFFCSTLLRSEMSISFLAPPSPRAPLSCTLANTPFRVAP